MAKTDTSKAAPKRKQAPAKGASRARKSRSSGGSGNGVDSLSKLLEHPLVAELISVAAIAAVAAIADHNVRTRTGEGRKGSKQALKAAGTAAASAIGKRLMTEFDEIQKASKDKTKPSRE